MQDRVPALPHADREARAIRREVFTAAAKAFIKPDLIEPFAKRIEKVTILYNSDVNCSGRRMDMSS